MALSHRLSCAATFVALLSLAGCGGNTFGTGSSGDVQPLADTAWQVNMSGAGGSCPNMASVTSAGQVDDQSIDIRVVSGSGASVKCSVVQAESGFQVSGLAQVGFEELQVSIPSISQAASMASPAVGTVTFLTSAMVAPCSGSCDFFFSGHEGIGPGKAWLSFTCAGLSCGGSPAGMCPAAESFVVFENCATM
jgi:hypothetical protein